MNVSATLPSLQARSIQRPLVFLGVLLAHVAVAGFVSLAPNTQKQLPLLLSSFEMVDLPSPAQLAPQASPEPQPEEITQPEPEPMPETPALPEKVELPPEQEVEIIKPPQPAARIKPVLSPKPKAPALVSKPVAPTPKTAKPTPIPTPTQPYSAPQTFVPATADAAYLNNPKPFYPRMARKRGLSGTVLLLVNVSEAGHVSALQIKTSSGHKVLDNAAIETVKKWKFQAAKKGKKAVSSVVEVPIRFLLNRK